MKIIKVSASKSYDIILGFGLISTLGKYVSEVVKAKKLVIVTDSNVFKLYGKIAESVLKASGFEVFTYVLPAGEISKNTGTYLDLITYIAQNSLTRNDGIVALGGGVVGDMAGFAASTYMRGISYIQVPTTLLAVIDSSVGGKTGIDLPEGKNLLGAFYQPDRVIADISLLKTLPEEEIKSGKGELIKYGVLMGKELWERIENGEDSTTSERILELCIEYKRDIVEADEKEQNVRKLLNLGHTAGHAIEKLSNYTLSHGKCVALGIAIVACSSKRNGELSENSYKRIITVLEREKLPTITDISSKTLTNAALNDKKSDGDAVTMVIIRDIGHCVLEKISISDMERYFVCK